MLSLCGAGLDRSALRLMERLWLAGSDPHTPASQEQQGHAFSTYGSETLLADPMAFYPQPPQPQVSRRIVGSWSQGTVERWQWPSGYRTWDPSLQPVYDLYKANQSARAEATLHAAGGRPTLICIHSWATGMFWLQRWAFWVRYFVRMGVDVVLFIQPFHGSRTPRQARFGGEFFPGTDPRRTNEAFGQTIWDLRSLIQHLKARGSGPIGAMGMSLGGYCTALLASVEPELHFAIPMIPLVSLADLMWEHGEGRPARVEAEARGITLDRMRQLYAVHSPLKHRPLVPRSRRLIVAGTGDRITPAHHVSQLWTHWDRPQTHWFPGSHLAHFGRADLFDAVGDFVTAACR